MAGSELLGTFQRPVLNQDPSLPAIAGGATLTLVDAVAPAAGILVAVISSDVSITATLTGATTDTDAGTAMVLSVAVAAGQRVTLTGARVGAPCYRVSGQVVLTPTFPINPADLFAMFTAAGQLIAGTGAGTGELLNAGGVGTVLSVGGSDPSGLQWATLASLGAVTSYNGRTGAVVSVLGDVTGLFTAKGQLLVGTGVGTGNLHTVGADGTVATADSAQPDGITWAPGGGSGDSDQIIIPAQLFV